MPDIPAINKLYIKNRRYAYYSCTTVPHEAEVPTFLPCELKLCSLMTWSFSSKILTLIVDDVIAHICIWYRSSVVPSANSNLNELKVLLGSYKSFSVICDTVIVLFQYERLRLDDVLVGFTIPKFSTNASTAEVSYVIEVFFSTSNTPISAGIKHGQFQNE